MLLFSLLALAGTGEAGQDTVNQTYSLRGDDSTVLLTCNEDLSACKGPLLEQQACYQRMKAAMRLANPYVPTVRPNSVTIEKLSIEGVSDDVPITLNQSKEERQIAEQWEQVMKDCVQ